MIQCPRCGSHQPENGEHCSDCGLALSRPCVCGQQVSIRWSACPNCGHVLDSDVPYREEQRKAAGDSKAVMLAAVSFNGRTELSAGYNVQWQLDDEQRALGILYLTSGALAHSLFELTGQPAAQSWLLDKAEQAASHSNPGQWWPPEECVLHGHAPARVDFVVWFRQYIMDSGPLTISTFEPTTQYDLLPGDEIYARSRAPLAIAQMICNAWVDPLFQRHLAAGILHMARAYRADPALMKTKTAVWEQPAAAMRAIGLIE